METHNASGISSKKMLALYCDNILTSSSKIIANVIFICPLIINWHSLNFNLRDRTQYLMYVIICQDKILARKVWTQFKRYQSEKQNVL